MLFLLLSMCSIRSCRPLLLLMVLHTTIPWACWVSCLRNKYSTIFRKLLTPNKRGMDNLDSSLLLQPILYSQFGFFLKNSNLLIVVRILFLSKTQALFISGSHFTALLTNFHMWPYIMITLFFKYTAKAFFSITGTARILYHCEFKFSQLINPLNLSWLQL